MNLIQKDVKVLLKEASVELDLPYKVVEDIYMSQFNFVSTEMKKGKKGLPDTYSNILLRYLGTFQISLGKMKYWINKINEEESTE